MNQTIPLVVKNIKFRIREPQQYLFIFGFPIMFLVLFYSMFKNMDIGNNRNMFDYFIYGLLGFITAFAVQSSSIAFSQEKSSGTLKRLQTTPVGSTNAVFLGFIVSELIIVVIQITLLYILAFGLLGVYVSGFGAIIYTFMLYLLLSITCVGIGLIMASLLNEKLASQIPMIIIMPFIFLSGAIMPLEMDVVYINPLFWVQQLAISAGFRGEIDLTKTIEILNFTTQQTKDTGIPLIWGLPIILMSGILFMGIGIMLFKKKMN